MAQNEFGKKSWGYAIGCIKACSHPPLTEIERQKLRDCDAGEFLRLLDEFSWGRGSEGEELDTRVEQEMEYVALMIRDICPDERLSSLLLWEKDAHNLKLFLKGALIGRDVSPIADENGSIPIEIIRASVETGDYSLLGKEAEHELVGIEKETDAFTISSRADRAIFAKVLANAKKLYRPLYEMLKKDAESRNRMSLIRAKELGLGDISAYLLPVSASFNDTDKSLDEIRSETDAAWERAMYDLRISEGFGAIAEYYFSKKKECELIRFLWCEKKLLQG